MQPAALTPPPQAFPLQELEQIERAIAAAQNCVATLQLRRELLTSELERITRPAPPAPKIIGPGFTQVAEKYKGRADAIEYFKGRIKSGGTGNWGDVLMPPMSQLSEPDLETIARWLSEGAQH